MQDKIPERFFVGGLFRNVAEESILSHFQQYGRGVRLNVSRDNDGKSLGYGWILFDTVDRERLLNGTHIINGAKITVSNSERRANNIVSAAAPTSAPQQAHQKSHNFSQSKSELQKRPREEFSRCSPPQNLRAPRLRNEPTVNSYPESVENSHEDRQGSRYPTGENISSQHTQESVSPSPSPLLPSMFACIPLSICPAAFLHDPRVFCCTLDPSQVGKLTIVATPTAYDHVSIPVAASLVYPTPAAPQAPQYAAYAPTSVEIHTSSPPPPPGPPPLKAESNSFCPPTQSKAALPPPEPPLRPKENSIACPPMQNRTDPPPPGPPPGHGAPPPPPPPGPPPTHVISYPGMQGQPPQRIAVPPPPGPPPFRSKEPGKPSCPPPPGPPPQRFIQPPQMNNPPPPGPPPRR